jgi:hypothetical protein
LMTFLVLLFLLHIPSFTLCCSWSSCSCYIPNLILFLILLFLLHP